MRIAMLTYHTSPAERPGVGHAGGLNIVVTESAAALQSRGNRIECYTRAVGASHERRLDSGVVVHAVADEWATRGPIADRAEAFGRALAPRLAAARVDVVHAHYWLAGLAAETVQRELGLPFVQTFHTVDALKARAGHAGDPKRHDAERRIAERAAAVVAVSRIEAGAVLDDLDIDPFRVWIVPPGVNELRFRPRPRAEQLAVRRDLGLDDDQPLLVIAGRIQPLKRQDFAIQVAARVPGAVLAIVGEPTPGHETYCDELRDLVRELGIGSRVRFLGGLDPDALAELFAAADVTLVPSDTETFGLVALESIASGTPIVASTAIDADSIAGSWADLVIDQPPMDANSWAETIRRLLDEAPPYADIARAAADERSWDQTASLLEQVYRSVIDQPR